MDDALTFYFRKRHFGDHLLKAFLQPLAKTILKRFKQQIGLEECKHIIVGADSMHCEIIIFFLKLDIPILNLYGISECTGVQAINLLSSSGLEWKIGSCGREINDVEMKFDNPDEHGNTEVKYV